MDNYTVFNISLSPEISSVLAGCFSIISFFGILLNGILILVIFLDKNFHSALNIFVINLAIGDIITAVTVVPFDADFMLRGYYPYGIIPCGIKETMFLLSLPSSVVNLLLLTFERFVFAVFPFKNVRYFTKRNAIIMVLVGWIYTINAALLPIYTNGVSSISVKNGLCYLNFSFSYALYQIFVNFALPVVIMVVLNISLFSITRKYQKQIKKLSMNSESSCSISFLRDLKNAKVILLLVGNFLICWLTFVALASTNLLCHGCHPRALTWFGNAINYSSIVFNPLIYGLTNKLIRKAIVKKINDFYLKINSKSYKRSSEPKADTLL